MNSTSQSVKRWPIIVILGLFSLVTSLSGSSTNLALPKMAVSLGVSSSTATWIVQVGLVTTTILLVMFGHIGDITSKTLIFLYGGGLFILGSLMTGIALAFWFVLLGRFIQAIGSAMIMANSMGIVTETFSDNSRAEALSVISMFIAIGSISGPALGGLIMSISSWRWIFLFNVPIGIIILIFGWRVLPFTKIDRTLVKTVYQQADWRGQNVFTIGILLFFSSSLFFNTHTPVAMLTGVVALVLGSVITLYSFKVDGESKNPWIDPTILHNKAFMVSIFAMALSMLTNAISNILLPFYLQSYSGLSPLVSGLIMGLQAGVMLIVTPIAGALADHWDRMKLTIIGLVVLLISQIGYAVYPLTLNLVMIIWPIVLNGIGMALFLSPNNAITMSSVSSRLSGVSGSFNSFARTIGMTVGISFGSTLLFAQLPNVKHVSQALGMTFVAAFQRVFWFAIFISVLALLIVLYRARSAKTVGQDSPK
ncbi:MFS transporter [Furfurilactobacillus entadae]|uniref:MFS transporter n=1 Tax=Furfurilactobacillus entadae TaxID=2922307 RepID=UPI0035E4E588